MNYDISVDEIVADIVWVTVYVPNLIVATDNSHTAVYVTSFVTFTEVPALYMVPLEFFHPLKV